MRVTICLSLALCACVPADGDDLVAALPRAADLTPRVPGGGAAAKPGEIATLYVATRRASEGMTGVIGQLVGTIEGISRQPPSQRGEGQAEWGPFTPSLSPLSYRLVAGRTDGGVAYHLDARPRLGGDFVPVLVGAAAGDGRSGGLRFDLARLRALDPTAALPDAQGLAVGYRLAPEAARLVLELDEAHYAYVARADGGGELGVEGGFRSRWSGSGAGRGEAPGVVECWDEGFRRVFLASPDGVEGDPAACPDVP